MKKKKQSLESGEFNLDDLEGLGDFNFGEVDSQVDPEGKKKDRSPVANAFKGSISGAKSTLMDKGFLMKSAREIFPRQYGEVADQVGETYTTVSALYNDAVREVKPAAGRVAKQIDKLVPAEYARTKKLTGKLAKMLGVEDDAPADRGPSREEAAFDEIGRVFSAQEEGHAQERAEDKAEGLVKDEVSRQRYEASAGMLSSINANVGRLAAYNDKINLAYQKKSLELQYRSIFAQTDLLDTSKRFFEIFKAQNDAITKNTALPDYAKLKTSERAADFARNKFMGMASNSLFGNGEFLKRGLANIRKAAGEKIKSVGSSFSQASMGLDSLQAAKDQMDAFGSSGVEMPGMAEMGGSFVGGLAAEELAGKAGSLFRKKFIKPGGRIDRLGYKLASGSMDAATMARNAYNSETLQNADFEGGLKGMAKRAAKTGLGLLLGGKADMSLDTGSGIRGAREHAMFDNRTQTSITTIIPGYLGRILREVKILRTGNSGEGMTVFDYGKGDFISMEASRAGVKERAIDAYNSKGFSYATKWSVDTIKGGENLSPEAERALRDRLRKHARSNDSISHEAVFNNSLYEGLDSKTADELRAFSEKRFGDQADDKDKNRYQLAKELRDLKSRIPDIREEVQLMVNAGYDEQLESLGIISKTSRGLSINFEKYSEIVARAAEGDDKEEATEEKQVSNGYNFGTRTGRRTRPFGKKGSKQAQQFMFIAEPKTTPPRTKLSREEAPKPSDTHTDSIHERVGNVIPIVQGIKLDTAAMLGKLDAIQANTASFTNFNMKESLDAIGDKFAAAAESIKEKAAGVKESGKKTFNKLKTSAQQYAPDAKTYWGAAKEIGSLSIGLAMAVTRDSFKRLGSAAVKINDNILKPTGKRIADFYNEYKEPVLEFSKNALTTGFELTAKAFGRARDIATDLVTKKLPVGYAMLRKFMTDAKDKVLNALDKPIDIYVEGSSSRDPVLLASVMRSNGYFDKETGEVIQRPSQIKGPVVNGKGEVVLTEADVRMGLIDQYGEKLKTPWQKLLGGAIALGKNALGNLLEKIPMLGNLGKRFADVMNNMFGGLVAGLTGGAKKRLAVLIQIRDLLNTRLPGQHSKFEDLDTMFRKSNANSGLRSADLGVVGAAASTIGGSELVNGAKEKAKGLFDRVRDKFKSPEQQEKIKAAKEKAAEAKDKIKQKAKDLKDKATSPETQERIQSGKDKAKDFAKKAGMALAGSLVPMKGNSLMDRLSKMFSGEHKFNENEKGERKGSWKQIMEDREKKNEYRNAHRDRNKASLDPRYKSSENIIDTMIRKAKELADERKKGLLEGAEDVADLADNLPEGQPKSRRELAKERLKRMKAAKAAKTGGRIGRVSRAMGGLARGAGNVLNAGGTVGKGILKTGQAAARLGGGAINAARAVGTPIAGTLSRAAQVASKVPGIARVGGIARTAATVGRVGLTAASLMMPGTGGLIAGGLSLAGSALGGLATVLASPVVLGAAAIGLAAYGGYKAYQYFTRNNTDDYSKIRLLQYGFGDKEKDQFYRALQLEEYLTKEAIGYDNGKAYIIEKKIDSEKLLDFFSVDKENKEHSERFVSWFNNRFKPFFLTSLTALFSVDNKAKLDKIEKLDPDKQLQYLKAAAYENGPYDATSSPFEKNEPLSATKKQVMDAIDATRAKLEKEKKAKSKDKKEPFTLSGKGAAMGALAGAAVAGPLGALAGAAIGAIAPNYKTEALNAMKTTASILGAPGRFIYDKTISVSKMLGYNLTALMSIRYKCYGLTEVDHIRSSVLNNLERHVAESVTYEKDNSSHYKEDMASLIKNVGPSFGVNDIEDKRAPEWIRWFNQRFLPVFLRYMAMSHGFTNKKGVEDTELAMTSSQKYNVAVAIAGTNGIWDVKDSPFRDYPVGRDKSIIDPNLNFLKDKVKEEKVQEEAKLAAAKKAAPAPVKKPEPKPPVVKPPKDTSSYHEVEPKTEGAAAVEDNKVGANGQKIPSEDGPKADPSQGDQFIKTQKDATLGGVQDDMLANFRAMAAEYGQKTGKVVGVNSGFRSYDKQMELYRQDPTKAAKPGKSLHEFGLAIDADSDKLNEMDQLGLMRKYGFTRPVGGEPWHLEPAGIQVNIAKAKEDPQFAAEAVRGSEGIGGGGVGSIPGTAKGKRDTQLALNIMGVDASVAPKADRDAKDNVVASFQSKANSEQFSKKKEENQTKQTAQREVPKSASNGSFDINTAGKTYASSAAASMSTLQETNSKSGTFEQAQDAEPGGLGKAKEMSADTTGVASTIDSAARATGMDPNVMKTFAAVESGMNPNARAPGSSAAGLFQFTRGTWNEVTAKYGGKYGISPSTPPTDPKASALMAGEYLKQNARVVDDVKPQLNATDLYLTHFLGPGGAKQFLSDSPGDIGASAMPKAAAANKSIFYENGRALSLGQIYTGLSGRLKRRAREFGIEGNPTAPAIKGTGTGMSGPDTISNDAHVPGVATMQPAKKTSNYQGQTNSGYFKPTSVTPGAKQDISLSNTAPAGAVASNSTASYTEQTQKPGLASAEESLSDVSDTLEESLDVQKQMLAVLTQLVGNLSPEQLKQLTPKLKEAIDNGVKADDTSKQPYVPTSSALQKQFEASNKPVAIPEDGVSLDRVLVA